MPKNLWSRNELIVSLNLYLKLPFGKLHHKTKEVIDLARIIGRTPNSVAMRLSNFASVDPFHQKRGIAGLSGGRKQVEPIWNEFINNREELLFESEKILADFEHKTIEAKFKDILEDIENLKGETKSREVKTRVNQNTFRQIVLTNYSNKCAISGIDIPELLIASHILPWAKHEKERLDPQNGICLSPLYDKCFDKALIGIAPDFKIHLSRALKEKIHTSYFTREFNELEGRKITLPQKFLPKKEYLEIQFEIFLRN